MWHTWLGFFGLLSGLVATGIFGFALSRSLPIGFAIGIVLAALWNVTAPTAAPCLQNSKGWDILRAYTLC